MKYSKSNNNQFYNGLKQRVDHYFKTHGFNRYANNKIIVKAVLLLSVYIGAYVLMLGSGTSLPLLMLGYALLGLSGVMIVFNLVHDASHNALSKNKWLNKAATYLGDLVGINTHIWDIRHNIQHHAFTNVMGGDLIIENIPLVRLSRHQPYQSFHKYQPYYVTILYMFYSFYWIFVIDIKLFLKKEICNLHNIKHSAKEWMILIAGKSFYILYTLLLPWLLTDFSFLQILGCFIFMHMCAGLLLSSIAVLGHFVEGPSFPEADKGVINNSWSEHELEATIDFAPRSRIINFITGGLNTHVAHHLFPNICHIHYYELTKIIEDYCREYNYGYKKESFAGGLKSHFRYLKALSRPDAGVHLVNG